MKSWSHVNENEKQNRKKSKIYTILKKKSSGDMMDRYLSPKFDAYSFGGI